MVLLHGGLGTVEDFAFQTPELAKRFKVVAFERPGHGHSPDTDEPFTFKVMSEYTIDLIGKLAVGPSNLVGWSDGAIVALLVAISRPDLVKRLVSVGGLFDANAQSPQVMKWIASVTPESFRKVALAQVKRYEDATPDGPAHFPVVFKKTMKMWLTEPHIRKEELAKITAPTLVMAADGEDIPVEHTLELFRSINDAQLSIIPGANHFMLSERPDLTTATILEFLQTGRTIKLSV